jgi:exonuclease SbcD
MEGAFMRIIHTADWHIGQELHSFSRRFEHEAFLDWLLGQCRQHMPDALLIAGDVFHHANPSNESMEMFARFTERVHATLPSLVIVAVAGNHDSPSRFDALVPLARPGVRLVGAVPRRSGRFDVDRLLVRAGDGAILAMPFLRLSDLPPAGTDEMLPGRVARLYRETWETCAAAMTGVPCVVTGHLHVSGGQESESERPILIGGEQAVSIECFPPEAAYVALGHLHLPQHMDSGRVRYSGSPIPLTAKERTYPHEIVLLDIAPDGTRTATGIPVPRSVPHLLVPSTDGVEPERALDLIASTLAGLGVPNDLPVERRPFVEISLRLNEPRPKAAADLTEEVVRAGLPVRLVRIVTSLQGSGPKINGSPIPQGLDGHTPQTLFPLAYKNAHAGKEPGATHVAAFNEVLMETPS